VVRVVVVVEWSSGCGAGSPMMVRVMNPAGQMSLMALVVVVERVVVVRVVVVHVVVVVVVVVECVVVVAVQGLQ